MKRWFISSCLFLAVLVPVRAEDKKSDEKKSRDKKVEAVTVPFETLKTGHMAVMITVNGKGPYRVIFDTGAPFSLLTNKVAKEAGLEPEKGGGISLFGMKGQCKVKKLEVGKAVLDNSSAMIMDHPTVKALGDAVGGLEGIIGFPVFARFKTTLNYQDKTLTFEPNGFEPPDVMESMMASVMSLVGNDKPAKQILSPSAQWGMVVTKKEGDDDNGVTIKEVMPGGAAELAGLKAGDRMLTMDGRWTDSVNDTYQASGLVKAGTPVKVVVKRDGKEKVLTVKPVSGL